MHWTQLTERGSILGLKFTAACYRLLGERAAKLMLAPVVAYFFLTGTRARRASHDYFARLRAFVGEGSGVPRPGWTTSFRHMTAFAESGLHKLAAWMGHIDPTTVDFPNRMEFEALIASGKGALLIGAHLGNLEMTRALAIGRRLAQVNAVIYAEHAPRFQRTLARASTNFGVNLIQVPDLGPDTGIMLKDKVDRGELLVIVGDRTPPADSNRCCVVEFLGAPAPFAQGPFILAAALECPVYLFFCIRESDGYRIHFERFADRIDLPRNEREHRLREYAQRYAHRLQHYCLRSPYQWFNFYEFWQGGPGVAGPKTDRRSPTAHAHRR